MTVNTEAAIAWMMARKGRVTYSMDYRNGPSSYDCSSSVYFALRSGGASDNGWAVNTEYEHDWLTKNGYQLIAENNDVVAQRGDIFIWGRRGQSAGAFGHTGIFIDPDNIIHCNFGDNGISITNYDRTAQANGWPYMYIYRYTGAPSATTGVQQAAQSQFERELDVNTPLAKSDMPYYEASLSTDYYVETSPDVNSKDKEFLPAGTRVRVYEKQNGWARINHPQADQWVEDSYLINAMDM
ncbi:peptidoglycan amidohydrolase family protein [Streptococcus sp. zg-JUN1979]|uniref:peptidoglycan amidohydrolase family protein n=1 Tax=Streptococcus sp. zg-JUN1979 TaxID=3391450 RepID=UPI0039A4A330